MKRSAGAKRVKRAVVKSNQQWVGADINRAIAASLVDVAKSTKTKKAKVSKKVSSGNGNGGSATAVDIILPQVLLKSMNVDTHVKKHLGKGRIIAVDTSLEEKMAEEDVIEEVVTADSIFWEVESIHGKRKRKVGKCHRTEFLVKWVGYDHSDNTWEPGDNLSDTAITEARRWEKEEKARLEGGVEAEARIGLNTASRGSSPSSAATSVDDIEMPTTPPDKIKPPVTRPHETQFNWNSTADRFLNFRSVDRVDLSTNVEEACDLVTAMRQNGIPIVLTGVSSTHGEFAKKWTRKTKNKDKPTLNIPALLGDIGKEVVPVIEQATYTGKQPIRR